MNTIKTITTSKVNVLATSLAIGVALFVVGAIFTCYYSVDTMSFTQEFSAFGLGW
jgi:hypothetical protein